MDPLYRSLLPWALSRTNGDGLDRFLEQPPIEEPWTKTMLDDQEVAEPHPFLVGYMRLIGLVLSPTDGMDTSDFAAKSCYPLII